MSQHSAISTQHFRIIWWKVTREQSHSASGKGCCTILLGSRIRSAWFNCWCQFFRCLAVILFLSLSLEPWCWDWVFFYYHCYYVEKEGWLFCAQCHAVGVLFLLFHDVALLLCDEGHGSPFEAVTGDGCHSEGPGRGLMSAFYILGREPQVFLHVVFHGLPLTHTNSLT